VDEPDLPSKSEEEDLEPLRAAFVPWHGPVFWPYAYSDVFDYAFWLSGYDDGYFAYAYDDFFDGVFWGPSRPAA
jgi:hypothetical protein